MEIRRFFVKPEDFDGESVSICGEEFIHAVKVLRQKVGFTIIFSTGDGYDYYAEITQISKDNLTAKFIKKEYAEATPKKQITLYQGSLKGGKNDFVVQKAVELGVTKVVFFDSKNVVEKKISVDRLNKIAVEAMKQCGRADRMDIEFIPFKRVLERASEQEILMFYEGECQSKLCDLPLKDKQSIAVIVGSEGGFDTTEVAEAVANKIKTVSLGKRVLRAETASVVAVALVADKIGGLE